ncbi:oxidoreductase [Falsiroseomonas bella]|uniref:Oxidoreductase n=1 Tax=Falsiroseomonas bella TaxID=2184016 RepID=A0A317FH70_9PROT|nr:Gfo/Idh/MocA family oxidoreductase [Falsiroseomonas bella]PWS38145.1 oxidoreductase [Falsiroseomonas bella]
MAERRIGLIMNGVTGRMGMNQHLIRSIAAIRAEGGVKLANGDRVMPDPVLVGRNREKLEALAKAHGIARVSTDLDACLADPKDELFFDAATTQMRAALLRKAIAAGKHIYCEKPTADSLEDAMDVARLAKRAGIKAGVVQDKLFLPGLRKLKMVIDSGFLGRICSVKGEFGYWVFEGDLQPAQRPSWNYKKAEGGGIILDMLCHWRYVLDNLFGEVEAVSCLGAIQIPERIDEAGKRYKADADDAAYATFQLAGGIVAHINSSWVTRVRRDDLVTFQVDGTHGSAIAGLQKCWTQSRVNTPKPVWNPDIPQPIDFYEGWQEVPSTQDYPNGFRAQWELFFRYLAGDVATYPWDLLAGAKGVQLAEAGLQSWAERRWIDLPKLEV